ncbi:hypothetical protein WR25_20626 isoform B [Diploscapter pachys]|uniref:Uncharacterized protein n=1 Tax=Diploscapter pachys TaxID=2018661 RepID=A0A2A2KZF7_9BILA|nr:hypothetical protein WR25_20626 isoform B [Diploscapter pachys]
MVQSFEGDIVLSEFRENLPSSSNAPTNGENENKVPEVFEMLQRGTPVYNIINSTWKCPISLSEKIQVFDSIESQMPEIVRKEYHKWRFLQMDRNELPSFIINEYPELKKILTILYKKADGIDALEEFGQWAAQLDSILRDKFGFRAWADSQMLDLNLPPIYEETHSGDVPIYEIPPSGYESDDDSVESLVVQRVDWKTVIFELVDLENDMENSACLLKIVTSASPATELFLELCSGINNYGQNGLSLGFMLIGLYVSDQVDGSLEFPGES